MAELAPAPDQPEPLAEWLESSLQDIAGRDPLGLNTITLDRVLPQLVPGILQLSERARYFSIYSWMLWQFQKRRRPATGDELDHFIRRREFELCLAMHLCPRCNSAAAIGTNTAEPLIRAGRDPLPRGISVQSYKGGFGLYYRSPLIALGAVAEAGTPLGADQTPTPIEVLLKSHRAMALAETFHKSIEGTEYYRRYERAGDPIPRAVLEELAESVCLCRLSDRPDERDAIRTLLFTPVAPEAEGECDARRRAFALFLSLLDDAGSIVHEKGAFWRSLITRFQTKPNANDPLGRTTAAWAALAMKECMQDALCSIWTDFCRTGVEQQEIDGFARDELVTMIHRLCDRNDVQLGETELTTSATEPASDVQQAALVAASGMDWEDLRAWVAEQNTAAAGLVGLLIYAHWLPDLDQVHPLWRAIAGRRSEYQDGLLGVLSLLRHRLEAKPTLGELLEWAVVRFVIAPHEAIAYSKLPKATFRFYWEENGRMRFFTPGGGGLDRFEPSDDRRGAMATLNEDIGYWEDRDAPRLTQEGRAFVEEVFR
jgi:hypothetical protein